MANAYKRVNKWRAQAELSSGRKTKDGFKTKREALSWAFALEQDLLH